MHWGIYLQIESIFTPTFVADTYSSIKGRGVHKCSYNLRRVLKDIDGTKFCLKIDIKKFYPSINNEILKTKIRRKIKCKPTLKLLDEIIDSAKGLPLGNLLSQILANVYLNDFDHYLKQELKIRYYFRYCDDLVILSNSKESLHEVLFKMRVKLKELNLEINKSYQVFPVEKRGIDFLGFKHYHTHTLLRKTIKKKFIKKRNNLKSLPSYKGWLSACDSINLTEKYYGKN